MKSVSLGFVVATLLLSSQRGLALSPQAPTGSTLGQRGDLGPSSSGWVLSGRLEVIAVELLSIKSTLVIPDFIPSVGMVIGGHKQLDAVDLGVQVLHHPGGDGFALGASSSADAPRSRVTLGSLVSLQGKFRWRFAQSSWGGLYLGLSPGVSLVLHSQSLRTAVEDSSADGEIERSLKPLTLGGSVQTGLGVFVSLAPHLSLDLAVSSLVVLGPARLDEAELSYLRFFTGLALGLEWRV